MTDQFDFGSAVANAEAYHPPVLPVAPSGNYLFTIATLDDETSSGGFPMLKLKLESEFGVQWDNIVISPAEFSIQKLLGLIESAGLDRPDPKKGEIDPSNGRLSEAYRQKLLGRQVGGLVRDEEDNRPDHAGEVRPRIKGYADPAKLNGHIGPLGDNKATAASVATSPSPGPVDPGDVVPFLHEEFSLGLDPWHAHLNR